VCPGSRAKISALLVLPQNRHPERSASQIDRGTQRLWRGVEGPRRCLSSPILFGAFQPPNLHDLREPGAPSNSYWVLLED
jgi:hypothetical protein